MSSTAKGAIAATVLAIVVFLSYRARPTPKPQAPPPAATPEPTANPDSEPSGIHTACHRVVSKALIAPASAKWSGIYDEPVVLIGPGKWRCSGTVDSQNRFGAMLRNRWSCIAERKASGEVTVRLENISQ